MILITLGACKESGAADGDTKVFKYDGSVQCDPASGIPLEEMQRELTDKGIDVVCAQSGYSGLLYPQVCGAGTGKINIYTIREPNLPDAEALGFSSILVLPDYQDQVCTP